MSRKIECLKRIAQTLGAECDSNDNTTCETLSKIADALPNALGGSNSLYEHNIRATITTSSDYDGAMVFFKIYNDKDTVTASEITTYIKNNFNSKDTLNHYYFDVTGYVKSKTGTYYEALYIYYAYGPNNVCIYFNTGSGLYSSNMTISKIYDKVIKLI